MRLTEQQEQALEQGQSPDGLPINPQRKNPIDLEPGHYSYRSPVTNEKGQFIGFKISWYTVRKRGRDNE